MDERNLDRSQRDLTRAQDPNSPMQLARSSGFCQRLRSVFPHEAAVALITSMATQKTETIAGVLRVFNMLTEHNSAYKPLHKKRSKPACSEYMRMVVSHLLDKLVNRALRPEENSAPSLFDHILLQDGSSFAISNALQDVFPDRRRPSNPAALELRPRPGPTRDHEPAA